MNYIKWEVKYYFRNVLFYLFFLLLLDICGSRSVLWISKISELTHQFLLIFCMKIEKHEKGLKRSKKWPKMRCWVWGGGWETSNPFICIYLNMKTLLVFKLSAKTTCLEKIRFFSYSPKTCRPIRMQDPLNYNVSKSSGGIKVSFCIWLDIHRSNKSI